MAQTLRNEHAANVGIQSGTARTGATFKHAAPRRTAPAGRRVSRSVQCIIIAFAWCAGVAIGMGLHRAAESGAANMRAAVSAHACAPAGAADDRAELAQCK